MIREEKEKIGVIYELSYGLKVSEVMKKEIITITPDHTMRELRNLLRNNRISGVPVVEEGALVGIIGIEDLLNCMISNQIDTAIKERMSQKIEVIYEDELLVHAINKFDRFGYGRFPVVTRKDSSRLVGIITKGDIIHGLLQRLENEYYEEELKRFRASHIFEDIVAQSIRLRLKYEIMGCDFDRAGESTIALKKALIRLGFSQVMIRRITVASYEAEMNVVIFAQKGKMMIYIQPHQIVINIVDSGPGIADIEQAMQPGFSTAPEWVREMGFGAGMGLLNIQRCADKMKLISRVGKGTRLELIFNIPKETI